MVNKISFENYKAFRKGSIDIKPITILLGANSVGKSSILQLILMLQQTALTNRYKSALRLHGEYISMGENENIFKDKDTSKDLVLTFQFSDDELLEILNEEFYERLESSLVRYFNILQNYSSYTRKKDNMGKLKDPLYFHFGNEDVDNIKIKSKKDFIKTLNKINELRNSLKITISPKHQEIFFINDLGIFPDSAVELSEDDENNYAKLYNFLTSAKRISNNSFNISFCISNVKIGKESVLKVTRVKLTNSDKVVLDLILKLNSDNSGYSDIILKSGLIRETELLSKELKKGFLEDINYNSTLFYLISTKDNQIIFERGEADVFSNTYLGIISRAIKSVQKSFGREMINYVSPLRAHPKRYYFLDKANISTFLDTLDGNSLTEMLKENKIVKRKVNNWLKNFNLSVDVSTLRDVIHNLKVRQNGLSLDITDVGFGISQVLPVIVQGFLSYKKSITIIEQPEIHLHPKMQADLADLFIDIALHKNRNKKSIVPLKFLLIETHSEYLLKRLRRRVAENETINSDNVAIYYFHPRTSSSSGIIEKKEITQTGFFDYPKDFYSGELLMDNVEFIKRQIK